MRLVLSAGEASGDQIGADLARALTRLDPGLELAGLTGPNMAAAGVETWCSIDQLNVMGLTEVIGHLPRLVRLRRRFRKRIERWRPEAFIGIDAPDFNLGLARQLKGRGLNTIHYVSPSVWAWRAGRIATISRSLDLLLTLYPFEPKLYQPDGLKAVFVGHPLADQLTDGIDQSRARAELGLAASGELIALLPGSRSTELRRHARLLIDTADRLRERRPEAGLLLLLAIAEDRDVLEAATNGALSGLGLHCFHGRTHTGLRAADVALAASGTVTLEAFLLGCPLVVFYRLAPGSYWLARSLGLVKSQWISLPNILTGRALVPELVQAAAKAESLSSEALTWLNQPERVAAYRAVARRHLDALALGAGARAATVIVDYLRSKR